MLLKANHHQ